MIAPLTLVIRGRPTSQKNSKRVFPGRRRPTMSKQAAKWMGDALTQLIAQRTQPTITANGLTVVIRAYCGKGVRPDADNLASGPLDSLQKSGVIANDNQIDILVVLRDRDREDPRIEIDIYTEPVGPAIVPLEYRA